VTRLRSARTYTGATIERGRPAPARAERDPSGIERAPAAGRARTTNPNNKVEVMVMVVNREIFGQLGITTRRRTRGRGAPDLIPGRLGTRLYDGLIEKLEARGGYHGGPTRRDLINLREEQLDAPLAEELAGAAEWDPDLLASCAMLQSPETQAIIEVVVSDPAATLPEAIEAVMVSELADHETWIILGRAALTAGEDDLATKIADAECAAAEHVMKLRRWLIAAESSRPRSGKPAPVPATAVAP
jgi:hypothetical protein